MVGFENRVHFVQTCVFFFYHCIEKYNRQIASCGMGVGDHRVGQ